MDEHDQGKLIVEIQRQPDKCRPQAMHRAENQPDDRHVGDDDVPAQHHHIAEEFPRPLNARPIGPKTHGEQGQDNGQHRTEEQMAGCCRVGQQQPDQPQAEAQEWLRQPACHGSSLAISTASLYRAGCSSCWAVSSA